MWLYTKLICLTIPKVEGYVMDTVDAVQVNSPGGAIDGTRYTITMTFIQFLSQLAVVYNFIRVTWSKKSKIYNVQDKKIRLKNCFPLFFSYPLQAKKFKQFCELFQYSFKNIAHWDFELISKY